MAVELTLVVAEELVLVVILELLLTPTIFDLSIDVDAVAVVDAAELLAVVTFPIDD